MSFLRGDKMLVGVKPLSTCSTLAKKSIILMVALLIGYTSPASAISFGRDQIHLHGYFTLEYFQATEVEGTHSSIEPDPTNGSFDLHHINFLVDFRILPELVAKLHVEFDHGADTELSAGDIILEYGFGEYTFENWLKVRAGKELTPFGFTNEIHDTSPAYVSVLAPENVYKADNRGGFAMIPKWTTGISLSGSWFFGKDHHDLSYVVFTGNGESRLGTNQARYDDNTDKAIGGRLLFSSSEGALQVGVSGFFGDKAVDEDNLEVEHKTLLFSLAGEVGDLALKGEYGFSELGEREEAAFYLQGSYRIDRYTPYFRYQTIDPSGEGEDYWDTYMGGLNVFLNDNTILKIEWSEHIRGEDNNDILTKGNEEYGELRTGLTLFF